MPPSSTNSSQPQRSTSPLSETVHSFSGDPQRLHDPNKAHASILKHSTAVTDHDTRSVRNTTEEEMKESVVNSDSAESNYSPRLYLANKARANKNKKRANTNNKANKAHDKEQITQLQRKLNNAKCTQDYAYRQLTILGHEPRPRATVMFANRPDKSDLQIWGGQRSDLWLIARMYDRKRRRGDIMWVVSNYVCDFDAAFTLANMRNSPMSPMRDEVNYNQSVVIRGEQARADGKFANYETIIPIHKPKAKTGTKSIKRPQADLPNSRPPHSRWDDYEDKITGEVLLFDLVGYYDILLGGDIEQNPGPTKQRGTKKQSGHADPRVLTCANDHVPAILDAKRNSGASSNLNRIHLKFHDNLDANGVNYKKGDQYDTNIYKHLVNDVLDGSLGLAGKGRRANKADCTSIFMPAGDYDKLPMYIEQGGPMVAPLHKCIMESPPTDLSKMVILQNSPSGKLQQSHFPIGTFGMRADGWSRIGCVQTKDHDWRFYISYDVLDGCQPDVVFILGGIKMFAYCQMFGDYESTKYYQIQYQCEEVAAEFDRKAEKDHMSPEEVDLDILGSNKFGEHAMAEFLRQNRSKYASLALAAARVLHGFDIDDLKRQIFGGDANLEVENKVNGALATICQETVGDIGEKLEQYFTTDPTIVQQYNVSDTQVLAQIIRQVQSKYDSELVVDYRKEEAVGVCAQIKAIAAKRMLEQLVKQGHYPKPDFFEFVAQDDDFETKSLGQILQRQGNNLQQSVIKEYKEWVKEQCGLDKKNTANHVRTLHNSIRAATGCIGKPETRPLKMGEIGRMIEYTFGSVSRSNCHFRVRNKDESHMSAQGQKKCRKVAKELQKRGVAVVLYTKGKRTKYTLYLPGRHGASTGSVAMCYSKGRIHVRQSGLISDLRNDDLVPESQNFYQLTKVMKALRQHVQSTRMGTQNEYASDVPILARDQINQHQGALQSNPMEFTMSNKTIQGQRSLTEKNAVKSQTYARYYLNDRLSYETRGFVKVYARSDDTLGRYSINEVVRMVFNCGYQTAVELTQTELQEELECGDGEYKTPTTDEVLLSLARLADCQIVIRDSPEGCIFVGPKHTSCMAAIDQYGEDYEVHIPYCLWSGAKQNFFYSSADKAKVSAAQTHAARNGLTNSVLTHGQFIEQKIAKKECVQSGLNDLADTINAKKGPELEDRLPHVIGDDLFNNTYGVQFTEDCHERIFEQHGMLTTAKINKLILQLQGFGEYTDNNKRDIAIELSVERRHEFALCDTETDLESAILNGLADVTKKAARNRDCNYTTQTTYYDTLGLTDLDLAHCAGDEPAHVRSWTEIGTEHCNQPNCSGYRDLIGLDGMTHCTTCRPLINADIVVEYQEIFKKLDDMKTVMEIMPEGNMDEEHCEEEKSDQYVSVEAIHRLDHLDSFAHEDQAKTVAAGLLDRHIKGLALVCQQDTLNNDMLGASIQIGDWSQEDIAELLCADSSNSRLLAVTTRSEALVHINMTGKESTDSAYSINVPRNLSMCSLGHIQKLIWGILNIVRAVRYGTGTTLCVPFMIECTHGTSRTPALYHNFQQMVQLFNDPKHIYTRHSTVDQELSRMAVIFANPLVVTTVEHQDRVECRLQCAALAFKLARQGTPIASADLGTINGHGSAITLPEYGLKFSFWLDVFRVRNITSHVWFDHTVCRPGHASSLLNKFSENKRLCETLATLNQETSRNYFIRTLTAYEKESKLCRYTRDMFSPGKDEAQDEEHKLHAADRAACDGLLERTIQTEYVLIISASHKELDTAGNRTMIVMPGSADTAFDRKRNTCLLQKILNKAVGLASPVHIQMNDTQNIDQLSANLLFKGTWSGDQCTMIARNVDAHLALADYSGFLNCQVILIGQSLLRGERQPLSPDGDFVTESGMITHVKAGNAEHWTQNASTSFDRHRPIFELRSMLYNQAWDKKDRMERLNIAAYIITVMHNLHKTGNVEFYDVAGKCERALRSVDEGRLLRFNVDLLHKDQWGPTYRGILYEIVRHIDDLEARESCALLHQLTLDKDGLAFNMQLVSDGVDTRSTMLCQSIYRGEWQIMHGTSEMTNGLIKAPTYDRETVPGLTRNNLALDEDYSQNGKRVHVRKIKKIISGGVGMPEIPSTKGKAFHGNKSSLTTDQVALARNMASCQCPHTYLGRLVPLYYDDGQKVYVGYKRDGTDCTDQDVCDMFFTSVILDTCTHRCMTGEEKERFGKALVFLTMNVDEGVKLWEGPFSAKNLTRDQVVNIMVENMFCYAAFLGGQIREPRSGQKLSQLYAMTHDPMTQMIGLSTTQRDLFDLHSGDDYVKFCFQNTSTLRGYHAARVTGSTPAFMTVGNKCDNPLDREHHGINSFRCAIKLDVVTVNTYDCSNNLSKMAAFVSQIKLPTVGISRVSAAICFNTLTEEEYRELTRVSILGRISKFFRKLAHSALGTPSVLIQIHETIVTYIGGKLLSLSPLMSLANVRLITGSIITMVQIVVKLVLGYSNVSHYINYIALYLIMWGYELMLPSLTNAATSVPTHYSLEERGQVLMRALKGACKRLTSVLLGLYKDAVVPAYRKIGDVLQGSLNSARDYFTLTDRKRLSRSSGCSITSAITSKRLEEEAISQGIDPIHDKGFNTEYVEFELDESLRNVNNMNSSYESIVALLDEDLPDNGHNEELLIAEIDRSLQAIDVATAEHTRRGTDINVAALNNLSRDVTKGDDFQDQDLIRSNVLFYGRFGSLDRIAQIAMAHMYGSRIQLNQDGRNARENLEKTDPTTTDYGLQGQQSMWAGIIIGQAKDHDIVQIAYQAAKQEVLIKTYICAAAYNTHGYQNLSAEEMLQVGAKLLTRKAASDIKLGTRAQINPANPPSLNEAICLIDEAIMTPSQHTWNPKLSELAIRHTDRRHKYFDLNSLLDFNPHLHCPPTFNPGYGTKERMAYNVLQIGTVTYKVYVLQNPLQESVTIVHFSVQSTCNNLTMLDQITEISKRARKTKVHVGTVDLDRNARGQSQRFVVAFDQNVFNFDTSVGDKIVKVLIEQNVGAIPIDTTTSKHYFGGEKESLFSQLGSMRACADSLDWRSGGSLTQPVDIHWTDATRLMTIHMFTVVSHLKRLPNTGSTTFRYAGEQFNIKAVMKTSTIEGECDELVNWLQSPKSQTYRVGDSLDGCAMYKGQTCKMFDVHKYINQLSDDQIQWAQMNVGSGYLLKGKLGARACVLISIMAGMNSNGWHFVRDRWEQGPKIVNFHEFRNVLRALQALGLSVDKQQELNGMFKADILNMSRKLIKLPITDAKGKIKDYARFGIAVMDPAGTDFVENGTQMWIEDGTRINVANANPDINYTPIRIVIGYCADHSEIACRSGDALARCQLTEMRGQITRHCTIILPRDQKFGMDIGPDTFEGTLQEVRNWSEKHGSLYQFGRQLEETHCCCRDCVSARLGYRGTNLNRKELQAFLDDHSRKHIAQLVAVLYTYGFQIILEGDYLSTDYESREIRVPSSLLPIAMTSYLLNQNSCGYKTMGDTTKGAIFDTIETCDACDRTAITLLNQCRQVDKGMDPSKVYVYMLSKSYRDLFASQCDEIGGEKMSYLCYNMARFSGNYYTSNNEHIKSREQRSPQEAEVIKTQMLHTKKAKISSITEPTVSGTSHDNPIARFVEWGIVDEQYVGPSDRVACATADYDIQPNYQTLISFSHEKIEKRQAKAEAKPQMVRQVSLMCEDTNHVFHSGSPEAAMLACMERTKLVGLPSEFVMEKFCEQQVRNFTQQINERGLHTEHATLDDAQNNATGVLESQRAKSQKQIAAEIALLDEHMHHNLLGSTECNIFIKSEPQSDIRPRLITSGDNGTNPCNIAYSDAYTEYLLGWSFNPFAEEHHIKGKNMDSLQLYMQSLMEASEWIYCCDMKQFDASHTEHVVGLEAELIKLLAGHGIGNIVHDNLLEHYTMATGYSTLKVHPFNNSGNRRTSEKNCMYNLAIIQTTDLIKFGILGRGSSCIEGDDSVYCTPHYDSTRSFVPRCLGMECEDQWHRTGAETADFLNNTLLDDGQMRPMIGRVLTKLGLTCKQVEHGLIRHQIGVASDISRITLKTPCPSAYTYLEVMLAIRIDQLHKGAALLESANDTSKLREKSLRLAKTFELFRGRLQMPQPTFTQEEYTALAAMSRDSKEALYTTHTLRHKPSDELLEINEMQHGADFKYMTACLFRDGPYAKVQIEDLPSFKGKRVNKEKRLTTPAQYEPLKPYHQAISGLSDTFAPSCDDCDEATVKTQSPFLASVYLDPLMTGPSDIMLQSGSRTQLYVHLHANHAKQAGEYFDWIVQVFTSMSLDDRRFYYKHFRSLCSTYRAGKEKPLSAQKREFMQRFYQAEEGVSFEANIDPELNQEDQIKAIVKARSNKMDPDEVHTKFAREHLVNGNVSTDTPTKLIDETLRIMRLIRRRSKTHRPILRHYFVRPLLVDGDVESNPGPVFLDKSQPRAKSTGLFTKYRVFLTAFFFTLLIPMALSQNHTAQDTQVGGTYFFKAGETLPQPTPADDTKLDSLVEKNQRRPAITGVYGESTQNLLNSDYITAAMWTELQQDHPKLMTALTKLVQSYKDGPPSPTAAMAVAQSPGFSFKDVWAVRPKDQALTGVDRTKMFEVLARNGGLFWQASCPFLNVPAKYQALMGPGSQLSIVLIEFGFGINIQGYNELRDEERRGAQERVQSFNAYNQKMGYNYLSRGRREGFYTSVNIGSLQRSGAFSGPGRMPQPTADNFGSKLHTLAKQEGGGKWIELLRFTSVRYVNPFPVSQLPGLRGAKTSSAWRGESCDNSDTDWTEEEIDEALQEDTPLYGGEKRYKRARKFRSFLAKLQEMLPGRVGNIANGLDWIVERIERKNEPTVGDEQIAEMYRNAVQLSLPQVVENVLNNTWDRYADQYAVMMFSPFSATVKGTRIPMMKPLATTTEMQYTDLGSFTIEPKYEGLLFTSFTAVWNAPWVLFPKLPIGWQNSPVITSAEMALNGQFISATSEEPGVEIQPVRIRDQLIPLFEVGVSTTQQIRDVYDSTVYASPNTPDSFRKTFTKLRVVGAGYRLFKTSASQQESGLIKQIAMPQGRSAIKNASELLNYPQDDDLHQRIYVASRGQDKVMGTTGFLSQLNYQPNDVNDTENFYRPEFRNTAQASDLGNGDQLALRYCGPIRQVVRFITPPDPYSSSNWQPNTYYLLSDFIREAISASLTTVEFDGIWIAGSSIDQPHLSVSNFEGVNQTVTFELQMIQHFEGTPTSKSQFLETGFALLDIKFATAMDIIRQFNFDRYFEGDQLVNSYDEEVKVQDFTDTRQPNYTRALSRLKAPSTRTHDLLGRTFVSPSGINPMHLDNVKPNDETSNALRSYVGPLLDSLAQNMGLSQQQRDQLGTIQGEVGREVSRHMAKDITGVLTSKK